MSTVNIGKTRIGLSKGPEGIFRHYTVQVDFEGVEQDKIQELAANMVKTLYRNRWAVENKGRDSASAKWPAEEGAEITIPAIEFTTKQPRGRKQATPEQQVAKMTPEQLQAMAELIQRKLAGFTA